MNIRSRREITATLVILSILSVGFLASVPHKFSSSVAGITPIVQQPTPPSIFKEYNVTAKGAGPEAIVWGGNNNFWFTEFNGSKIGELFVNGTVVEFSIPNETGARPAGLAVDHQGRIWFADQKSPGSIWEFVPSLGANGFKQYLTPSRDSQPIFVLVDSSDNIWFTEGLSSRIGMFPFNGSSSQNIREFVTPTSGSPGSGPDEMALQMGTTFLWITEYYANKIARFDMSNDRFQEFTPTVSLTVPVGIIVDGNGSVWISEHGGSSIIEFTPSGSTWRKYPTSMTSVFPVTGPATLAIDGMGRLWFVEHYANRVGRLDPSTGTMDEFAIPTTGKAYSLLNAVDPQNNFWFTEFDANQIGMIQNNATSPTKVIPRSFSTVSVVAGQSISGSFSVSDTTSNQVTFTLGVTSSFSPLGQTSASEVSLSSSSVTLNPGENKTVVATITPDFNIAAGIYAAGIVSSLGGISSVGTILLQVQANLWYQLETVLPEILAIAAAGAVIAFLVVRRRKTAGHSSKKIRPKLTIAISVVILLFFLIQQTGESWAKCPGGLPPPPVGPGGPTVDYYGIALDLASIAFFGIVAYILIRDRLRRGKGTGKETPQSSPGSGT